LGSVSDWYFEWVKNKKFPVLLLMIGKKGNGDRSAVQ